MSGPKSCGQKDNHVGLLKTAAALLRIDGNLERVISNSDKVAGQAGANLRNGIEIARLSRKLVSFKADVPLGLTWRMLSQNY